MKTIYAFDFDGTITKSDTLLGFIGFVFGKPRMALGFLLNLPWLTMSLRVSVMNMPTIRW